MELLLIAFLAGMITVLTPCVLPVLPVILSGSLAGTERLRPLIITASLIISIFFFTLLLKASTALINIPPEVWTYIAGGIVFLFGLTLMFPNAWFAISEKLGFEKSQQLIQSASQAGGKKGMIFLGMALGPVFASCSPTYALILAVVLPQDFTMGITAMIAYCIGLFVPLFLIAYGGRRILGGFRWFANPQSKFRKGLGVLLVIVGVLILTGYEKKLEAALLDNGYFDFTKLEQGLVENIELDDEEKEEIMNMSKEQNAQMRDSSATVGMEKNESEEIRKVRSLLNVNYPAPELVEPQNWINSEPLTLEGLKGKVVMIDFWTYSCINCIRTLPALKGLHDMYDKDGLVILGVHSPEFAFEKVLANVQKAVDEYELKYPIFQDNDFKTWRAYKNRYWPAKYIIDKEGNVRYTHFGEGAYEETEQVISYLLSEGKTVKSEVDFSMVESSEEGVQTGETYLGTDRHVIGGSMAARMPGNRQAVFVSPQPLSDGTSAVFYTMPENVEKNQWWLTGDWKFDEEKVVSTGEETSIGLRYSAATANLVMGFSEKPVQVEVWLDGKMIPALDAGISVKDGKFVIDAFQLYYLTGHDAVEEHTVELRFKGKGVELYAWTFG
jgi:cytochrome c biogenesis protein CcdA/thiol-disulfide isomerase/thioredoxin